MKRNVILAGVGVLVLICAGCGSTEEAKEYAQETADIVAGGDMEEISQLVFGYQEPELDKETAEMFSGGAADEDADGILSGIFERVTIEVKKVKKDAIEYEIGAPDLSGVFDELAEGGSPLSDEDFAGYLREYIAHAEIKKRTVSVPYEIVDDGIEADYQSEEFINAITGGLLESYQKIYQEMMEGYAGGE